MLPMCGVRKQGQLQQMLQECGLGGRHRNTVLVHRGDLLDMPAEHLQYPETETDVSVWTATHVN